jgi:hypothetical protein
MLQQTLDSVPPAQFVFPVRRNAFDPEADAGQAANDAGG